MSSFNDNKRHADKETATVDALLRPARRTDSGMRSPQDVVADSRVVSFYSNATAYQSIPVNPTPNGQVQIRDSLVVSSHSSHGMSA